MTVRLNQVIRYEVAGKEYKSYVEAEAAVIDMFGEHIDGIFMEIEKETGRASLRFKSELVKLVEKMWRDRVQLSNLLGMIYNDSEELRQLAENMAENDN